MHVRSFPSPRPSLAADPGDGRADDDVSVPRQRPFSILYGEGGVPAGVEERTAPDCFEDLNLDQLVDAIVAGRDEYELKAFFNSPLTDRAAITYRQAVMRDLACDDVSACVEEFAEGMRATRRRRSAADNAGYELQERAWFLLSALTYCGAVDAFAKAIGTKGIDSPGLRAFRDHLSRYVASRQFKTLAEECRRLRSDLDAIRYTIEIFGDRVRVAGYAGEADYSAEIERTFRRFHRVGARSHRARFVADPGMNHVEARILGLVAKLNPEVFEQLGAFRARNAGYLDATIARFDREVQFYLAYLDFRRRLSAAGLRFCYPQITDESKEVRASETFDAALAQKRRGSDTPVVTNEWRLDDPERIFVVSGPNQGGKTTFARTFGQLHYLASLGCPVPGRDARLFLADRIFTHFERREDLSNLRGKLEDDLVRVRGILERATPKSIVVMNESFSSTALEDARFLGAKVLERITELDLLAVYVTFVEELASLNEKTVSLTSMVDAADPSVRTFKVMRRKADGRAYAKAIAEKYHLTYDELRRRIA